MYDYFSYETAIFAVVFISSYVHLLHEKVGYRKDMNKPQESKLQMGRYLRPASQHYNDCSLCLSVYFSQFIQNKMKPKALVPMHFEVYFLKYLSLTYKILIHKLKLIFFSLNFTLKRVFLSSFCL